MAFLDVVINDKTGEATQSIKRNLDDIRNSSKKFASGVSEDIKALDSIKSMAHNLAAETSVASNQLKALKDNSNFGDIESAKKALNAMRDLKVTVDNLGKGYSEAKKALANFNKEYGGTGIYKTKSAQNMLKDLDKSLSSTGKRLGTLSGEVDGAINTALSKLDKLQNKAANTFDGIYKSVKRILAAYLSWQGIKGIFNTIIEETRNQEKANALLEARLKSTRYAAGLTAEELKNMSERLRDMSIYEDDAILSAENLLLTFKNVKGDTFERATRAVLDMSTAVGGDLESSVLRIGKALQEPTKGITALRRVGVQLTGTQEEMIKNFVKVGDVAAAQNIILKELESQFGGSAKAARNTLGGAIDALKIKFRNLFEANPEGEFSKVTKSVNELTNSLETESIKKFRDELVDLAAKGIEAVNKALKFMAGNIETIKSLIGPVGAGGLGYKIGSLFGGPAGGVVGAGVGALSYKSYEAATENEQMRNELEKQGYLKKGSFIWRSDLKKLYNEKILSSLQNDADAQLNSIAKQTRNISPSGYTKSSEKSSTKKGKSAVELMVENIKDQMKYLYADGESFLPVLDQWLAKFKPLSNEWKVIKDLQLSITENARKQDPLSAENVLERNKQQIARMKELKEESKRLRQEYYDNLNWENAQGLLGDAEYLDVLKEHFRELSDQLASTGISIENMQQWTPEMRSFFAEIQNVSQNAMGKSLDVLKRQYDNSIISQGEYREGLEALIKEWSDSPLAVKILKEEIKALDSTTLTFRESLRAMYTDAKQSFNDLGKTISEGLVEGFARAIAYGDSLGDTLKRLGQDIIYTVSKMLIMQQVTNLFGNFLGIASPSVTGLYGGASDWHDAGNAIMSAKGNVFEGGTGLHDYVNTIVSKPTIFPFAKGVGLMGEDGAEGIFPLGRNSRGELGIKVADNASASLTPVFAPTIQVNVTNNGDGGNMSDNQAQKQGEIVQKVIDARFWELMSQYHRSGYFRNAYAR